MLAETLQWFPTALRIKLKFCTMRIVVSLMDLVTLPTLSPAIFFISIFIFLTALGLSCGMPDLVP